MSKTEQLVGRIGEFTDLDGIVRQCRVTGIQEWEGEWGLILIDYAVEDGGVVRGAVIGSEEFRETL